MSAFNPPPTSQSSSSFTSSAHTSSTHTASAHTSSTHTASAHLQHSNINSNQSLQGAASLSELEKDVLEEYRKVLDNLNKVCATYEWFYCIYGFRPECFHVSTTWGFSVCSGFSIFVQRASLALFLRAHGSAVLLFAIVVPLAQLAKVVSVFIILLFRSTVSVSGFSIYIQIASLAFILRTHVSAALVFSIVIQCEHSILCNLVALILQSSMLPTCPC